MGDRIVIIGIEVIQDGLFQIDFKNINTGKCDRSFINPEDLFGMIGEAMQLNHNAYLESK
jgi:hypothetical protein